MHYLGGKCNLIFCNITTHFVYIYSIMFSFFREKEADLETRYKILNIELQKIASIEDWRKTEAQRAREQMLLEELVQIVNKRDELVHHLDNQEKA